MFAMKLLEAQGTALTIYNIKVGISLMCKKSTSQTKRQIDKNFPYCSPRIPVEYG